MRVGPLAFACDTLIKPELANGPHYIVPCATLFFRAQAWAPRMGIVTARQARARPAHSLAHSPILGPAAYIR